MLLLVKCYDNKMVGWPLTADASCNPWTSTKKRQQKKALRSIIWVNLKTFENKVSSFYLLKLRNKIYYLPFDKPSKLFLLSTSYLHYLTLPKFVKKQLEVVEFCWNWNLIWQLQKWRRNLVRYFQNFNEHSINSQ